MHLWRFLKKTRGPSCCGTRFGPPHVDQGSSEALARKRGGTGGGDEGGRRIQKSMDVYLFLRFFLEKRKIQNGRTGGNLESVVVIVVEDYWTGQ